MHPAAQQAKLAAALKLITDEADPIQVRVKMAYVWGYIDALADAGVVSRKPRNFRQPINMACLALGR